MATRRKTLERAWDTRLTNLATATALASAGEHEFINANGSALTLQIPESSLAFKSVYVELTARDAFGVARTLTGVRIGIKLGSVAYNDEDTLPSLANTGDHECFKFRRNVTSYFTTNWSGSSMTCQVRVRFQNSADAQNVNNITCKLIYTYEYDGTSSQQAKTGRIPIMSHHTSLGTSAVEIGTTGGTNNAPANQIPDLDDYLVESGIVIDGAWIEIEACENAGATTTDHALTATVDTTDYVRATIEQALATGCYFFDILTYDTATHTTSVARALKMLSSVDQRYLFAGAVLYITYRYTESSTTRVWNSLYLPVLANQLPQEAHGTVAGDLERPYLDLLISEPGTITTLQSGIRLYFAVPGSTNTPVIRILGGGQAERSYSVVTGVKGGEIPIIHRCDHGTSPWAFSRGRQRYYWSFYTTTNSSGRINGGWYIVNYTSDKASGGTGAHNQSCAWFVAQYDLTTSSQHNVWSSAVTPTVDSHYWLNAYALTLLQRRSTTGEAGSISAELKSGEYDGDGWINVIYTTEVPGETSHQHATLDLLAWTKRSNQDPETKMVVSTARTYRAQNAAALAIGAVLWTTHHEILFQVTGTVSGWPSGDGSGITVKLWNATRNELVGSTTTATGGTYTINCYDNVDTYYTEARFDATHVGRSDNTTPVAA